MMLGIILFISGTLAVFFTLHVVMAVVIKHDNTQCTWREAIKDYFKNLML